MIHHKRFALTLLAAITLFAPTSFAVIAVKLPVSQIYDGARTVIVGSVTKINPETGAVEATATALRGNINGGVVRFKLEKLPAILSKLKEGSPVVLLTGEKPENFALHLADTWLLPEPTPNPQLFAVRNEKDLKQSYPGTTAALAKIVQARAADKYDMLDKVTDESSKAMFHGGTKDLGKFDAPGVTAFQTIKALRGNRKSLVALSPDGLKFFSATAQGITSARASLPAIPTTDLIAISVADLNGNGAPVILALKKTGELMLFETPGSPTPTKTIPLWKDNTTASAAAFGNFGEDDKTCAIVIKDDNIYRYALDGQSDPADFLRLTGERVTSYRKDTPKWLTGATAAPLDINNDGKTDLLINTPSGPMLLINRGYGAFFIDPEISKVLTTPTNTPLLTDKSRWTAIDIDGDGLDDLLIVSDTGAATAIINAKAEKKD
jgi:hypothetical protein